MCSASFLLESRAVLEIVTALWFQGQQKSKEPHPGREQRPSTLFCILNDVVGSPNVYELYFSQLDIKTSKHTIIEFQVVLFLMPMWGADTFEKGRESHKDNLHLVR